MTGGMSKSTVNPSERLIKNLLIRKKLIMVKNQTSSSVRKNQQNPIKVRLFDFLIVQFCIVKFGKCIHKNLRFCTGSTFLVLCKMYDRQADEQLNYSMKGAFSQ